MNATATEVERLDRYLDGEPPSLRAVIGSGVRQQLPYYGGTMVETRPEI
ncbi:hypothetical protein [Methanoculleus sp.]|nr:hypothetical protein [Methanoculleus sp.]MDI6866163.1 hypothetical protein [Methanoculleus sp.]